MRIVFAGHKERGAACLAALIAAGHDVRAVVLHPGADGPQHPLAEEARRHGLPTMTPGDINAVDSCDAIAAVGADLMVLAGYGQILKRSALATVSGGCLNLHGGRLPEYRGSSPMNWALIRGDVTFTLSVIVVDTGVDTGDVVTERTLPIKPDDTIAELQKAANEVFPVLLLEAIERFHDRTTWRRQDESRAAYYPLRFPNDGLIVWDLMSATDVHNRIRALTDPYPGAFTYFGDVRIRLLRSRHTETPFFGEPGRVYRISGDALLVCASDRCLWIDRAEVAASGLAAARVVKRYDGLLTAAGSALATVQRAT